MLIPELILTSIALAMDAFSVSICKGLGMKKLNYIQALIIAAFFGVFQAVMPLIGFLLIKIFSATEEFQTYVSSKAGLFAFALLAILGAKMLWDVYRGNTDESVKKVKKASADKEKETARLNYTELLMLAIATSIDALMTGFAFAVMQVDMVVCITMIGCVTFILSFVGVFIGHFFGAR